MVWKQMDWKQIVEEARTKGETIRDDLVNELTKSKVFREFLKSDFFARAVTSVLKTKDEVYRVIRDNVKTVIKVMNLPKSADLKKLETKLDKMEKSVGRVARRTISVRSLKPAAKKSAPLPATKKKLTSKSTKARGRKS